MSILKSIRIPNDIYRKLQTLAEQKNIDMTDCILRLIRHGLKDEVNAIGNGMTNEELIDKCRGNGEMIAKMIYASFPDNVELLQSVAELEQLNFSLDSLNEGLQKSPHEDYCDWLRCEVLRLELARWPAGYVPHDDL